MKNRCFLCQSNYTDHFSGICHICSNGEIPDTFREKKTEFIGNSKNLNNINNANKKKVERKRLNLKDRDTIAKEGWKILVKATKKRGEWVKRDVINEFKNESQFVYVIGIFRIYLECRKCKKRWCWKVKDEYVNKKMVEPDFQGHKKK